MENELCGIQIEGYVEIVKGLYYKIDDGTPWSNKIKINAHGGYEYSNSLIMLSCTIDGYYRVNAYGKNQLWHRLVYKHFKGTTPKYIDHKNNNRIDNRIENLQEIERYNNTIKSKIRKTNKSGMPGVHWSKERECWKSCINSQGKKIGVRFFTDKIMAFKHYIDLRIKHHGKDTIEPIKEIIIKELGFDYYSNLAV